MVMSARQIRLASIEAGPLAVVVAPLPQVWSGDR